MLHEIAACDLDITHIVNPIRKLLKNVQFFEGDVQQIDLESHTVTVCHGADSHTHDLPYDHLVLALGSVTNFFGLSGLRDHALTMKSLGDAIHLRNRVIENLENADGECAAGHRSPMLRFVVAGGGFAGVETIAAINDFVREALCFYRNLNEKMIEMVLIHPGEVILPELGPKLGAYAQVKLVERGVDIRVNTKVTNAGDGWVELSDGSRLETDTLIWTAGTSPHPILMQLACQKERGRPLVNEFLEVPEWRNVWAVGDCACVPDPRTGKPYPPTAQHAIRQAKVLAGNIEATLKGGQKKPFLFNTIGLLASIGRRTGVARIFGYNFSGFIAWWMWRSIYLSKLPRFEKKLRVAIDWSLDLLFSKDIVQFLTSRSTGVLHDPHQAPIVQDPHAGSDSHPENVR
jgi:NADH dehydrogenase